MPRFEFSAYILVYAETEAEAYAYLQETVSDLHPGLAALGVAISIDESPPTEIDEDDDELEG